MGKAFTYCFLFLAFLSCNAQHVTSIDATTLKNSKPNIILVMTDDQGPHLSYMGHPLIQTPHIDAFAEKSLRLTDFHVSPTCSPTRAAIMSGRHEFRNGVTATNKEREHMALSTTTFAELLVKSGYATGMFGKWHLGDPKPYRPMQRGFTESLLHGAGGIGQLYPGSNADFPGNQDNRYFDNYFLHNEKVVQTKGYCADVFFDAATSFIDTNIKKEQPFFAYISTNTPHAPDVGKQENIDRIKKRYPDFKKMLEKYPKLKAEQLIKYYAMIENIDDNFGKLMNRLEKWDALENTLIIFTTDNGATSRHGGTEVHNGGFKTGKGSVQEGGMHVPCFWYWKGKLQENIDVKALTAHIDLYKTFCDLAGAEIPNTIQEIDGRSLLPLLEKPKAYNWEDRMLFHTAGRWKAGVEPQRDKRWGVRTQKWRLVGSKMLFDIENDPYENNNLIKQHPEVAQKLTKAYHAWWEETLPFMINENKTWDGDAPFVKLYNEAKKEGIPMWEPSN